ncbi:MAG: hypothetical protein ACRDNT_18600 [Streptosporangiaceae bacterium]
MAGEFGPGDLQMIHISGEGQAARGRRGSLDDLTRQPARAGDRPGGNGDPQTASQTQGTAML